ncbi:MAG: zinc ribbon domain-containing protein [Phycisphaerales bacterium]|nr:zinc ribbon domain-containing protein [Phycisphaerales bacterium]
MSRCAQCAYDLTDLADDVACPECGLANAGALSGTLDDITCLRCGYALHAPERTSRCPECGCPAALSLNGIRLGALDPRYLRGISVGARLMFIGGTTAGVLMLMVIALLLLRTRLFIPVTTRLLNHTETMITILAIAHAVAAMCFYFGWIGATRPAPHIQQRSAARRATRSAACIMSGACIFVPIVFLMGRGNPAFILVFGSALLLLTVAISNIVLFYSSLMYIRVMSHLMPDKVLFERAGFQMIITPMVVVMFMVIALAPIGYYAEFEFGVWAARIKWALFIGVYALAWILYIRVAHRFSRAIRQAIGDSLVLDAEAERLAVPAPTSSSDSMPE